MTRSVQLLVCADAEPDVAAILERLGNLFEAHDVGVELGAAREVADVDGVVVEGEDVGVHSGMI